VSSRGGGDADGHGVEVGQGAVVGGGAQRGGEPLVALGGHVDQVGGPGVHGLHPLGVEVDAGDLEALLGEGEAERQPGVAEADDPEVGLARREALGEGGGTRDELAHRARR
jgi:hypothetical protein